MFSQLKAQFSRLRRIDCLAIVLVGLDALVWLAGLAGLPIPGAGWLQFPAYLAAVYLLFRLFRIWIRALLWRVRNRMVLLFALVGFVPLLLVAGLVGIAAYMLTGQAAIFMVTSELDRRAARLQGTAAALEWSLRATETARHREVARNFLERAAQEWTGLQAMVLEGGSATVYPTATDLEPPQAGLRDYRGIVRRRGRFYLTARATESSAGVPGAATATDSITALRPFQSQPRSESKAARAAGAKTEREVILLSPLSPSTLASFVPGLGRISLALLTRESSPQAADDAGARAGGRLKVEGESYRIVRPAEAEAPEASVPFPPAANRFDGRVGWPAFFRVEPWGSDDQAVDASLHVETRPSAVFRLLFGQRVELARGVVLAFIVIAIMFLIVELVSLVVGVSLTRTLTSSVHQLYQGTLRVNRGDFSGRIPIRGADQIAELSRSFNSMTASIERLIEESKERQRLASELAIAREVQEQLFPKTPPVLPGLEILGVCHAARMVSGDYFDFIRLRDDRLAIAVGDVAGKGISGALLMASIQSMLRSQLTAASGVFAAAAGGSGSDGRWNLPTAQLVSQLNRQLYESTSPEKYATFFFGAWDDARGLLAYTNAGHLPPIMIHGASASRLEVNGMVVGAFPNVTYEQSEIQLSPGDLLVAFTDGVTEPENEYAEEFGEDRLVDLLLKARDKPLSDIINQVIRSVVDWAGRREEMPDDMTIVAARRK